MANPRRISLANTNNNQSSIFANQTSTPTHANSTSSRIIHFLKKPHAFPFLLSVFLFLTWLSLKLQHSNSRFSPPTPTLARAQQTLNRHDYEDDAKAGLVRFPSGFPSPLAKDTRGWMLDPISLALTHHLSGMPTVFPNAALDLSHHLFYLNAVKTLIGFKCRRDSNPVPYSMTKDITS